MHGGRRGRVAELDVADLVRDEERLLEGGPDVLVDDEVVLRNERRAAVVEDRQPGFAVSTSRPAILGFATAKA